ncbi:unnamed protein product [Vitrella brassicaformis CCMP3155]|uniref:ATPase AAA-type core domain-containing protein n=1 Tax=Vitrella brassicaformis (strain CCMP3155) TaxID=1169540 RepID=A0A0G4H4B0_VITBC|nr:unnamed protein product [Vitrella brassicaformis CCMP3155]|eukprot:CEM38601.1 unnamed protein product [Vitrella brassicaformis CCMP3155]
MRSRPAAMMHRMALWDSYGKGPIASAAIDAAQSSGIILVDEIDKICNNQAGQALQHALLPLLDGTDIKTSLGTEVASVLKTRQRLRSATTSTRPGMFRKASADGNLVEAFKQYNKMKDDFAALVALRETEEAEHC